MKQKHCILLIKDKHWSTERKTNWTVVLLVKGLCECYNIGFSKSTIIKKKKQNHIFADRLIEKDLCEKNNEESKKNKELDKSADEMVLHFMQMNVLNSLVSNLSGDNPLVIRHSN